MSKEIKFKAVSWSRMFKKHDTSCRACILHNKSLKMDEIVEDFARYAKIDEHDARYYATYFVDYLVHAVSEGYRLNLDAFSLYLTMKGNIDGANGHFDSTRNSLELNIRSQEPIKDALSRLTPVNVTMDGATLRITSVMDGARKTEGVITMGATVFLAGYTFLVDASRGDEGVWLEDGGGKILLRAQVLASSATTLDCIFSGDVEPGEYRIVVSTRMGDPSRQAPVLAKHKINVV